MPSRSPGPQTRRHRLVGTADVKLPFQFLFGGQWKNYQPRENQRLLDAYLSGAPHALFGDYLVNFDHPMKQLNLKSGTTRDVRPPVERQALGQPAPAFQVLLDGSKWTDYPLKTNQLLLAAYRSGAPHAELGDYVVTFSQPMKQKNLVTGTVHGVRAPKGLKRVASAPAAKTASPGFTFQVFDGDKWKWRDYPQRMNELILDAYCSGAPYVELGNYVVNFANPMKQLNRISGTVQEVRLPKALMSATTPRSTSVKMRVRFAADLENPDAFDKAAAEAATESVEKRIRAVPDRVSVMPARGRRGKPHEMAEAAVAADPYDADAAGAKPPAEVDAWEVVQDDTRKA